MNSNAHSNDQSSDLNGVEDTLTSHVLVCDDDSNAMYEIKGFCAANNLVGMLVQTPALYNILSTNIHLGAIFISEDIDKNGVSGIEVAVEIHKLRPELPIFIRRNGENGLTDFPEELQKIFAGSYLLDNISALSELINRYIFGAGYPNEMVRGIREISTDSIKSTFKDMDVLCDTPYLVKDKIIYGELFSLINIESDWCRGYMMLQAEERSLMNAIRAGKTQLNPIDPDFRAVNTMLSELSNLTWGGFKSRFISGELDDSNAHKIQVPIIINHSHKYISFGSDEPQLCFRYTLVDPKGKLQPVTLYQKFVFSLSFSPENFKENLQEVDDLIDSGELEFF